MQGRPALPSRRYLRLLQKGAQHAKLAPAYQQYLQELQYYQATTLGKRLGAGLMKLGPHRIIMLCYRRLLPLAIRRPTMAAYIHSVIEMIKAGTWWLHDHALQYILGSGACNS